MTFDELLAKHLDSLGGDYVAAVEAKRFRDWMRDNHPDVLAEWLVEHEVDMVHRAINRRARRNRTRSRNHAVAGRFAEAARLADDGEVEPLSAFAVDYVVNTENQRKAVADMTGADHRYVATTYEARGARQLMLAQFHLAVAKKVGRKRTADVLNVEEYETLLRSVLGDAA